MLSKFEYDLLSRYRTPCPAPKETNEAELFQTFIDRKYVRIASSKAVNIAPGLSSFCAENWELAREGILALKSLEEYDDKVRAKKADDAITNKANRRFELFKTFIGIIITAILAFLAEHYFKIFTCIRGLFH